MPEQLLGTRGPALRWRQLELLRGDLGPIIIDEMNAYTESARFWPYFEQYATDWIWPQQQGVYEIGSSRGRGPTLDTVENRTLAAERIGDDKFTTWIRAIEQIAPNAFAVWKYYGDARRPKPVATRK